MDFLNNDFLGLPLNIYFRGLIVLLIGLILKAFLSKYLGKIAYKFMAHSGNPQETNSFALHIQKPLGNFIFAVFAYIAIMQIAPVLDDIWLFKRSIKPNAEDVLMIDTEKVLRLQKFTLLDLLEKIFFLVQIFTFTTLIVKIINYYFKIRLQKVAESNDKERQQLYPLLKDVLRVAVWTIMVFVILGVVFKVNVAALIAGLGVGGIAIAFALKDSLENLLSSFMILLDKPFTIGDLIKIDDVTGNVERVGFRSTLIRTFDKTVIAIPNKNLISNNLENFSQRGAFRVKMTIGAEYGLSQEQLKKITNAIKTLIQNHPETTLEPTIFLESFGDSTLNIQIIYFINIYHTSTFEAIKEAINFGIYETMYQLGTGFPYPTQTQLHGNPIDHVSIKKENA
ncbi:MAG TPA: mechanosensitive ion channel family protein [Edaphocola sp.]|nr:mechanosensitive ion channel family protein [Edaphocola sp.]